MILQTYSLRAILHAFIWTNSNLSTFYSLLITHYSSLHTKHSFRPGINSGADCLSHLWCFDARYIVFLLSLDFGIPPKAFGVPLSLMSYGQRGESCIILLRLKPTGYSSCLYNDELKP